MDGLPPAILRLLPKWPGGEKDVVVLLRSRARMKGLRLLKLMKLGDGASFDKDVAIAQRTVG